MSLMGSGILGRSVLCPNLRLCMALMQCSLSQNRWPWPPCVSRRLILRSFSILDPSVEQGNVARQRSAAQICNNPTDAIFCITPCGALGQVHRALASGVERRSRSPGWIIWKTTFQSSDSLNCCSRGVRVHLDRQPYWSGTQASVALLFAKFAKLAGRCW